MYSHNKHIYLYINDLGTVVETLIFAKGESLKSKKASDVTARRVMSP